MRRIALVCAFTLAGLSALAGTSDQTYDVRIFEVTRPISSVLEGDYVEALTRDRIAVVSLSANGLTPDGGFPLNGEGDILYWDRAETPDNAKIKQIIAHDNVIVPLGEEATITLSRDIPTQYLKPRSDGRYDLMMAQYDSGISLRLRYAGNFMSHCWYNDSRALQREPLPGVELDVGKPKDSIWSRIRISTPNNEWGDCLLFGSGRPDEPTVLVFVRMHATPEALAAAEAKLVQDQFTCNVKWFRLPASNGKQFALARQAIVINTDVKPLIGSADCFTEVRPAPGADPLIDWASVQEWLDSLEGLELLTAPRATLPGACEDQSIRQPPQSTGAGANAVRSWDAWPMSGSEIVAPFLQMFGSHLVVIADVMTENIADPSATDGTGIRSEGTGCAIAVVVEHTHEEDMVSLDIGVTNRFKLYDRYDVPTGKYVTTTERSGPTVTVRRTEIGAPAYYEEGFRYRLPFKLGSWTGFTYVSGKTGDLMLVFVFVNRLTPDENAPARSLDANPSET